MCCCGAFRHSDWPLRRQRMSASFCYRLASAHSPGKPQGTDNAGRTISYKDWVRPMDGGEAVPDLAPDHTRLETDASGQIGSFDGEQQQQPEQHCNPTCDSMPGTGIEPVQRFPSGGF